MCFSLEIIAPTADREKVMQQAFNIIDVVGIQENNNAAAAYARRQAVIATMMQLAIKLPVGFDIEPVQDADRRGKPWYLGIYNAANELAAVF